MGLSGPERKWTDRDADELERISQEYLDEQDGSAPGRMPSITGYALAIGFTCRQGLDRYRIKDSSFAEENPRTVGIIARVCAKCEEANIQATYHRDMSAGARFVLQNGFGYTEKNEIGITGGVFKVELSDD